MFAYAADTLAFSSAFLATPNGRQGGIWNSGCAPASDANHNVYLSTGNGDFNPELHNYADSLLKFTTANGLELADYFTPYDQDVLQLHDRDLASGGVVVLPDEVGSATHPHLVITAGKAGTIYLVDRDNMGQSNPTNNAQIVQELTSVIGGAFSTPAYFNKTIYYIGRSDQLKAFAIADGRSATNPPPQGPTLFGWPGATPCITANGTNDAIVWAIQCDSPAQATAAILRAYAAADVTRELYNSNQAGSRDQPGPPVTMPGMVTIGEDTFTTEPVLTSTAKAEKPGKQNGV